MKRKKLTISIYDGNRIVLATSDPVVVEAAMAALEARLGVPKGSALNDATDREWTWPPNEGKAVGGGLR